MAEDNLLTRFDWRLTFLGDVVLYAVFLLSGTNWFLALVLTEALFWLVRLVWLSPMMLRFILRRLMHMIPIVLAVVAIGFGLIQLAPGDIFSQMRLNPNLRAEDLERFRQNFGLDLPWYEQFFRYLWRAIVYQDLGWSQTFRAPVMTLVSQRAGATVLLALTSLMLAWGFSIPAGIIAATKQYKWQDQVVSVFAFFGLAIPNFFLAFLLLYVISTLGLPIPIGGMTSPNFQELGPIAQIFDIGHHLILPVVVIGTSAMASLTRIMRANMLEIMNQQYVVTARAKGQAENVVVYKHALRNAINPMITILGFQLGNIMGGAALVEQVIAWPGLGNLILTAIIQQDLYLVVGSLVYGVVLLVIGNLIADILLAVVDPRVRIG